MMIKKQLSIAFVAAGIFGESAVAHVSHSSAVQHASEHLWSGLGIAVAVAILAGIGFRLSR